MKILVLDDNKTHRDAAQAQLKGHDLTVVGTYYEAQELLKPQLDYEKAEAILKRKFGDFNPYSDRSNDKAKKAEYIEARQAAFKQATTYPDFDVVLSDLLMPASLQQQGEDGHKHVGEEMPVGIFIGLLAAVRARAKYVAVFTDSNHHEHPASACFDPFDFSSIDGYGKYGSRPFRVEDSKVLLSHECNWVEVFNPQDLSKALGYEWYGKPDTVLAKNWAKLLAYLIA